MKRKFICLFACLIAICIQAAESTKLELVEASYQENDVFDGVEFDYVNFRFNKAMTVDAVYIVLENGDKYALPESNIRIQDAYYHNCQCIILDQLTDLRNKSKLNIGDSFYVRMEGVKDAENGELLEPDGGVLSLKLKAGRIILADLLMVDPIDGADIRPFYPAASAEGLIVFTFSEAVTATEAVISYGDVEKGTYGKIKVPNELVYDGNTISVDIREIDLYPSSINSCSAISLRLTGVKTADGVMAKGNLPGSPGTYVVNYNVKTTGSIEIMPDFVPAAGSNIDETKEIECWLNSKITFDAVRLSYTLGGEKVVLDLPVAMLRVMDDPNDEEAMLVYIPVADLSFAEGEVALEFVNAMDTEQYAVTITCKYVSAGKYVEKSKCLGGVPSEGALDKFPSGFSFLFSDIVSIDPEKSVVIVNGKENPLQAYGLMPEASLNTVKLNTRGSIYGDFVFKLRVYDARINSRDDSAAITYGDEKGYVMAAYSFYSFNCTQIEPSEGLVSSLKDFTLTFVNPQDELDFVAGLNPDSQVTLVDEAGKEVMKADIKIAEGDYPTQVTVALPEAVSEEGTYRLILPKMTVFNSFYDEMAEDFGVSMGAFYNPAYSFEYTIQSSGIEQLEQQDGIVEVYSIDGVLIRKADASVALQGLRKGIYLVNGKKVAVQ